MEQYSRNIDVKKYLLGVEIYHWTIERQYDPKHTLVERPIIEPNCENLVWIKQTSRDSRLSNNRFAIYPDLRFQFANKDLLKSVSSFAICWISELEEESSDFVH